ncbi:hypothetical protein HC251_11295 [Iamia sp. SCSIO 61187]|uniref:hypothetical protein n=1 Tax=Iamia sp. SCSIO 61187 TaxID=2722752 RepID=UPI001C6296D1|nr:hypothetical protein [Iamia sp. SCSIO 61187]QYG92956.1 hypothetical protein HC251_11295 [Iamia sp. SCSIO 61187]
MSTLRRSIEGARDLVDDALVEADEQWRVARPIGLALLVTPLLAAVAVAATLVHRPLFRWLTGEDGILEWSQFVADVIGVGAAVGVVSLLWRRREVAPALLWVAFAAALVFIAGEEISWGQRVFDLDTPAALEGRNHQGESNVHNIRVVQDSINVGFMLVGLYGSVVAVTLRRRLEEVRRPPWFDLVVPPMVLSSAFLLVFAYKLLRLVALQSPRFTIVKYGEVIELCTAGALSLFAILSVRRLSGPGVARRDGSAGPVTIDLRDGVAARQGAARPQQRTHR